jgi:predicted metal-binding membrane protein
MRRAAWHHPEWTVALAAAVCWAVLVAHHVRVGGIGAGPAPRVEGASATHHAAMTHTAGRPAGSAGSWLAAYGTWLLMAPAMMLPSALPAARHVALNSRWRRRQRGQAVFAGAYLALWLLFGLVAVTVTRLARPPEGPGWPLAAALIVAAGWELTTAKRRCLRACHRTLPLPPDGWKADLACARFGLRHGMASLGTCWALMAPMAIAGHAGLPLMVLLTILTVAEMGLAKGPQLGPPAALALVAAAAAVVV